MLRYQSFLIFAGSVVLTMVATTSVALASTMSVAAPRILESFTPNGVVPGQWRLVDKSLIRVNVPSAGGCDGAARTWQRRDGVQLRLGWGVCGKQQISTLEKSYAISQIKAPAVWRNRSALGQDVDLVQLAPGGQIWRFWLQGDLDLALETRCRHLAIARCASLAVPAAKYLAARLPGKPVATAETSLFPPGSSLLGAIVMLSLLLVGGGRLSSRSKLEKFELGSDPRLHRVDETAKRLRMLSRRRWWGALLAVVAVLFTSNTVWYIIHGSPVLLVINAAIAISLGLASKKLLRTSRHPMLSREWFSVVRTGTGMFRVRRLVSLGFTMVLGLLSLLVPLLVIIVWMLAGLASAEQDFTSILAGLIIVSVACGYFIDRAAQRLRAHNVHEAMSHGSLDHSLLYLRNFGDDRQKIPTSRFSRRGAWQRSTAWLNPFANARFEEVLARALARTGPVIAVSPTGGKLHRLVCAIAPPLGAAKTALRDDEWEEYVREWAMGARAVVLSATPRQVNSGFRSELQMVAEKVAHGRIVLVFGTGSKATLRRSFPTFIREVGHYRIFADLGTGWLPDGVLIMVHVPAEGGGTWHGWVAERRTAWTYTAAVHAAMAYAQRAWTDTETNNETSVEAHPVTEMNPLRDAELTEPVNAALDLAATFATSRGQPMDTSTVLLALMDADARGRWDRIWLYSRSREALAQTTSGDPPASSKGRWNGAEITAACTAAFAEAARISQENSYIPVSPGVLALGLISDRSNAACHALDISDPERQRHMMNLVQEELLGVRLNGLRLHSNSSP